MIILEITNSISFPIIAGLLAALAHVLSGPDHLAAVMPLAVENSKKGWRIGLSWALGHITGMLAIGLLFVAFKQWLPVEAISSHSEALVGFVLVFIGLWAFYRIFKTSKFHSHVHIHNKENLFIHSHGHHHNEEGKHLHDHKTKTRNGNISAYLVGSLHGLAGISHFLIFLPALGLKTTSASINYIGGFAIGTIIAMSAFALIISKTAEKTQLGHNNLFFKGLRLAAGSFAIIIGVYWILMSF